MVTVPTVFPPTATDSFWNEFAQNVGIARDEAVGGESAAVTTDDQAGSGPVGVGWNGDTILTVKITDDATKTGLQGGPQTSTATITVRRKRQPFPARYPSSFGPAGLPAVNTDSFSGRIVGVSNTGLWIKSRELVADAVDV